MYIIASRITRSEKSPLFELAPYTIDATIVATPMPVRQCADFVSSRTSMASSREYSRQPSYDSVASRVELRVVLVERVQEQALALAHALRPIELRIALGGQPVELVAAPVASTT